MTKKSVLWLLALVVLVGVLIRSYELTARSLWFDEAFSWRLIQFPFTEMLARDATDVHPPLYYILLKAWKVVFASSLVSLRAFSVFMAGLSFSAIYLFTSYAFRSRVTGIMAATFLALSAYQIQFAWEARMYTLGTFLALISGWLLLKAVRERKIMYWVEYGVVTAAFAYVHYYSFFTIAAQIIFIGGYILVITKGRPGEIMQLDIFWKALLAGLIMVLFFLPWLPTFLAQNAQVQESYWIPSIGGWSIPDTFYRMYAPTSGIPRHEGAGWISLAILPIGVTVLSWLLMIFLPKTKNRDGQFPADSVWLVLSLALTPFILSISLSFVGQSLYQDRFFVFANLFILVGAVALLARVRIRTVKLFLVFVLLVGMVLAYGYYWRELDILNKPGASAAAGKVYGENMNQAPVIVTSPFIYFAILHYAQEEFAVTNLPKLYSETGQLSHFAGGPILTEKDVVGPEEIENSQTLWVVDTTGFGSSKLVLPNEWKVAAHESYQEVFGYQGEVFVTKYMRE